MRSQILVVTENGRLVAEVDGAAAPPVGQDIAFVIEGILVTFNVVESKIIYSPKRGESDIIDCKVTRWAR
jgi:hypothetical protein